MIRRGGNGNGLSPHLSVVSIHISGGREDNLPCYARSVLVEHPYLSERRLAVEQEAREALERAWVEFKSAGPDEKPQARQRYMEVLRRFALLVSV
jgi:hypothetical protein